MAWPNLGGFDAELWLFELRKRATGSVRPGQRMVYGSAMVDARRRPPDKSERLRQRWM